MHLTIALATRGRPELLRQTLNKTLRNIHQRTTKLVVLSDYDDETMARFGVDDLRVSVSREVREDSLGEKFNRAIKIAPADVYTYMVDYAPHVTPGFDTKILEAAKLFPDGIGCVYGHMANMSFPYMQAVTQKWVDLAGGMFPGYFPYWFVDHWLDDLARMTDRYAACDVQVDVSARPGTQEHREPGFWGTFYDAMRSERHDQANRIIDAMDEPEWRKAVLRSRFHLIDERSMMINSICRAMPATDPTTDARYERIKARAIAKLREADLTWMAA